MQNFSPSQCLQARRDDLASLVYTVVELARSYLPWRHLRDRDEILKLKQQYSLVSLMEAMPAPFFRLAQHTESLTYDERPDYEMLIRLFELESTDSKGRYPPRRLAWSSSEVAFAVRGQPVHGDRRVIGKPTTTVSAQQPDDPAAVEPLLRMQARQAVNTLLESAKVKSPSEKNCNDSAQPAHGSGEIAEHNTQVLAELVITPHEALNEQLLTVPPPKREPAMYRTPRKQPQLDDADLEDSNNDHRRVSFPSKLEGALSPDIRSEPHPLGPKGALPHPPSRPPTSRRQHLLQLRYSLVGRPECAEVHGVVL